MACNLKIFVLLCAVTVLVAQKSDQGGPHVDQDGPHVDQGGPHSSQGGPHENQGRVRRQADDTDVIYDESSIQTILNWTSCDITVIPRISCHDCNTRLICKNIGGLLKICNNPLKPYCNAGICSPIPSVDCA